ncbi:transposase [Burkholderia stagnalis]|uniref:transposase n=1 Tax=Burkholderia stagnalis TaxID=1503054 RepID=UPI000F5DCA62|nr:transposase [Burkholderia stagnalis]RQZ08915.1 transposase [Burkholderia stagnalis]
MSARDPAYVPLTDAEWASLRHLFDTYIYLRGAPNRCSDRCCLDAILHARTIGCLYAQLPGNLGYPGRQTLYRRAAALRESGMLEKVIGILRRGGRDLPDEPEAIVQPTTAVAEPCRFEAVATLTAMQEAARARLVRGLPPDWRDDDV